MTSFLFCETDTEFEIMRLFLAWLEEVGFDCDPGLKKSINNSTFCAISVTNQIRMLRVKPQTTKVSEWIRVLNEILKKRFGVFPEKPTLELYIDWLRNHFGVSHRPFIHMIEDGRKDLKMLYDHMQWLRGIIVPNSERWFDFLRDVKQDWTLLAQVEIGTDLRNFHSLIDMERAKLRVQPHWDLVCRLLHGTQLPPGYKKAMADSSICISNGSRELLIERRKDAVVFNNHAFCDKKEAVVGTLAMEIAKLWES